MKHFLGELIGTFFLTLAIALTGNPLCYGLMFAAVIYIAGHTSGGYFNPAITVAFAMLGKYKRDRLSHLLLGQFVGAGVALYLAANATGQYFALPIADPSQISMVGLCEILLTYLLVSVVLCAAARLKEVYGLVAGFTLISLGYIGGLFNPAISLASQLLSGGGVDVNSLIAFFVCPLIGGVLAALCYKHCQTAKV